MSFLPDPHRVVLPELTPPATRTPFPLVATLAPLGVAGVAWAITQSPFALLFGLLGPVVAIAGVVDSRVHGRRARRERARGCSEALDVLAVELGTRADRVRADLARQATGVEGAPRCVVLLGVGDLPDRVELVGAVPARMAATVRASLERVTELARVLTDAPILADALGGVGVVGPPVATRSLARSLALQLRARAPDARIEAPADNAAAGRWTIAWGETTLDIDTGESEAMLSGEPEFVIRLEAGVARVSTPHQLRAVAHFRPAFASARQDAVARARMLQRDGRQASRLPDTVDLGELLAAADPPADPEIDPASDAAVRTASALRGLAVPIGHDGTVPVWLDLVVQGPHALVAGTTGSGKSELLIGWIVGMAARHRADDVNFLLVDFKGGAAFAPLAGLPHVVGTLSDLDDRLTARAVESLSAELRRRERVLAEHGVRSIELLEPGTLARLVIVVDEFAAMLGAYPDLHSVFADLAARGRSLGLHLVLCTQRPAGIVRDSVLANVTLRISLRVTDRGDAIAVTGSDAAAMLPARPRGRAVIVDGEAPARVVQIAIATSSLIESVTATVATGVSPQIRPWRDPLPRLLRLSDLPKCRDGVAFGLADLPAEQRQPVAAHDPVRHGALLVLGASGAGKTVCLRSLAESARAGFDIDWLPGNPADAWQVLVRQLGRQPATASEAPRMLLIDDLDVLLSRFDVEYRPFATELLAQLLREGPRRGVAVVASVSSASALASLANAFGSRLMLRSATREDHVLAGGDGASFDADAAPGSGRWRGRTVQVALARDGESAIGRLAVVPKLPVVEFGQRLPIALVSGRPRETRALLRDATTEVAVDELVTHDRVSSDGLRVTGGAGAVVIGDPDSWLAAWERLGAARRDGLLVLHNCSIADHRALTRARELPPPLGTRPGECWLVADGVTERALLVADDGAVE